MTLKLSEITSNQHYCTFAALFSTAMQPAWRAQHPEVPSVRGTLDHLLRMSHSLLQGATAIRTQFVIEWSDLLISIVQADPHLSYSEEDLDWFVSLMDSDTMSETRMVIAMLFAAASGTEWYTLDELSKLSGTPKVTLRKRAEGGKIPGAQLKGKTWLVPSVSLRAQGISIPSPEREEEQEGH